VLVFAEPERAKDALAAGATYAGGLELVEKVRLIQCSVYYALTRSFSRSSLAK